MDEEVTCIVIGKVQLRGTVLPVLFKGPWSQDSIAASFHAAGAADSALQPQEPEAQARPGVRTCLWERS